MFNIIYSYIFKYTRKYNGYTLQKEAIVTGIEASYLNKVENNTIIPSERIFNNYIKCFDIKTAYNQNLENFVINALDLICASNFKDQREYLNQLIEENHDTIYIPYLHLLLFAIKVGQEEFDDSFHEQLKLLNYSIESFPENFKRFFCIYVCQYYIKRHNIKEYESNYKILKSISFDKWIPMECYGHIIYYFHCNDLNKISIELENLKIALETEPNATLEIAMNVLYATYYKRLGLLDKAIEHHTRSMELWKNINDEINYACSAGNIAWIYMEQKNYLKAIKYWLIPCRMIPNENFCFNLAWCYYVTNQKNLALEVIKDSKDAVEVDQYHFALIKWLKYHIKEEYGQKAKKQLKTIYDDYFSTMTKDMQKFLLIALIKQAKHDNNHEDYYQYTDVLIKTNVDSLIDL